MYSPRVGVWLQRDPSGYLDEADQSDSPAADDGANLYQYTRSDPVKYVDPSGLGSAPVGAWGPAAGWNQQVGRDIDKANEQLANSFPLRVEVWANQQKARLGPAIAALGTGAACCKDPAEYAKQAQEYADAIVDAIAKKRISDGDQAIAGWSSWAPTPSTYACGQWQELCFVAASPVNLSWLATGKGCFNVQLRGGSGKFSWKYFVPRHQWVEIEHRGTKKKLVIDPWPSGGMGDVDDPVATKGWPTVK